MELFDSHAHYDDEKFNEDRDFIINEIYKSGVTKFVSAGYSLESSKIGIELAKKYDFIYTTSGISPNDIPTTNDELESQLLEIEKIAKSNSKVVAIGEIGLDYYWNKDQKELQKFSTSCKKMIKDELNISIEEKQIMNILKQNQFWNKMIHRMKNKLSSFSKIFVFIYSIMQSIFFRIIIIFLLRGIL